ncbi:MAG: hypothetical protein IPJ65_10320 [Archangiaceae bacterium]|nr:hypothetical protein [Archangiaceae bacterium]
MKTPHAVRIARDLLGYAWRSKRPWLLVLVVICLALIALVIAAASPASPFVYTLF